jgi:hypothetical protein
MTRDILDEFEQQRRAPAYPSVPASTGLVVEERASGFCGDVVKVDARAVTLRDRHGRDRQFLLKPGGFLLEGKPVTLVRPAPTAAPAAARVKRRLTGEPDIPAPSAQSRLRPFSFNSARYRAQRSSFS